MFRAETKTGGILQNLLNSRVVFRRLWKFQLAEPLALGQYIEERDEMVAQCVVLSLHPNHCSPKSVAIRPEPTSSKASCYAREPPSPGCTNYKAIRVKPGTCGPHRIRVFGQTTRLVNPESRHVYQRVQQPCLRLTGKKRVIGLGTASIKTCALARVLI